VTTGSGAKLGKSEQGAVWLDADRTSPYKFFQFWINADDRDAGMYLRYFTLLSRDEIESIERESAAHPEQRLAQRTLALEVTTRVHGEEAATIAEEVSALLFGGAEVTSLSLGAVHALRSEIPYAEVVLPEGGADTLDLLVETKLVTSRGAAKRLAEQGGVYVNGARVSMGDRMVGLERRNVLAGGHVLLRKGARDYALVKLTGR
jgi:tyrosyl-tRNA synthetase